MSIPDSVVGRATVLCSIIEHTYSVNAYLSIAEFLTMYQLLSL